MADAGYGGPQDKGTGFAPGTGPGGGPGKPGAKKPKKPQDRTPAEKKADQKAKQAKKKLDKQVKSILDHTVNEFGAGGAPLDEDFVRAALEQGLTPQQIKVIFNSGALNTGFGLSTSGTPAADPANFSGDSLVNYFTENPEEIAALFEAVKGAKSVTYNNYAEYLAQGGEVGGYQSPNQLLQAAVLGIGGAKEAYMAGTPYGRYLAEGNDPARWYVDRDEFLGKTKAPAASSGPSFQGGFDVAGAGYDLDGLNEIGLGDVVSQFLQQRQQKQNAQMAQGDVFDIQDLAGSEE